MDRTKGIFSSFLNAFRPKKKSVNPVFAVSGDERVNTPLYDHSSPSEELAKANPVFVVPGGKSLDELIASWKVQPDVHSHIFSSGGIVKATGNFNSNLIINQDAYCAFYKGFIGKKPVLIKKFSDDGLFFPSSSADVYIRDMVVASQLSSHGGGSLKLIGFCKEHSAQVFEQGDHVKFLSDGFESLSWRNRLSIARDIAKTLVILHTSFSTPVILRDLKASKILIDESGVAKLLDFSLCKQIPEGESQVEDTVMGTYGFADPQYIATGILTEKSDVFSFGVVLLELLTGQKAVDAGRGKNSLLHVWAEGSLKKGKLKKVVDPKMIEGDFVKREREFQAFATLALKCIQESRKDRPQMTDVAAELARIRAT